MIPKSKTIGGRVKIIAALIFILASTLDLVKGQSYSFKSQNPSDHFEIQTDENGLNCLFRVSRKKAPVTLFRKVFLNPDLTPIDSVDYSIEGEANLIACGGDESYFFLAFYAKQGAAEKIVFLVTDHFGKTQFTFSKTVVDFAAYFKKKIKKLKYIRVSFLPNHGSPGMILMQPLLMQNSTYLKGQLVALVAENGTELWSPTTRGEQPLMSNIQATDSLLIGISSSSYSHGVNQVPLYQFNFVAKNTGKLIKSVPFYPPTGYRTISVFTTNGRELMVAGSQLEFGNAKNGKFYMAMLSLSGEKIFDHVDSAARLSTRRMVIMGNVFDQDGNLVLVGEGWKPDATRAVVGTAASILLAVTVGGYMGVNTQVDHKIDHVVFATLSPTDGRLIQFKAFPVGPWYEYGNLMTEGSHVLISISNQIIIYDVNTPNTPPKPFTSLRARENLILTPSGPIINKWVDGRYVLSRLP